jgi:phosphate transport system substrate-binding protein
MTGLLSRHIQEEKTLKTKLTAMAAMLAASALVLAGCASESSTTTPDATSTGSTGGSTQTEEAGEQLTGSVLIDGSSTVGPLSEVAAELFQNANPGVRVTVAISGTGGGFKKFCAGETDGNNSSRPIKAEEIETCEQNGIAYGDVQVANDALSIIVNKNNPLQCLSVAQVSQVWNDGSTVTRWGDIDGLPAGLPEDFLNERIQLFGPGTDSGTFDFFTEVINGKSGQIRNDYINIGEEDLAAVKGVEGSIRSMGFIPFAYYQEFLGEVKGLAIDNGSGCIEPTPENVLSGVYAPLGRPLFVYASDTALARPEVIAFFEFYIANAEEIARLAGFVPMSPAQIEAAKARVNQLAGR